MQDAIDCSPGLRHGRQLLENASVSVVACSGAKHGGVAKGITGKAAKQVHHVTGGLSLKTETEGALGTYLLLQHVHVPWPAVRGRA